MKKTKKILGTIFVLSLSLLCFTTSVSAATTTAILTWHLVDSGNHMDWSGSTTYQSQFNTSVSTWNNYKSGVIRKDTWKTVNDVTISDYSEVSSTAGVTSREGTIRFNTYNMDNYTVAQKKNVCIHELGHALGLAHNQKGDVMYDKVAGTTTLSANDKASYDESYKRY